MLAPDLKLAGAAASFSLAVPAFSSWNDLSPITLARAVGKRLVVNSVGKNTRVADAVRIRRWMEAKLLVAPERSIDKA